MIVTRLMGGHSNQLFQYAAARRLAIKHRTSVIIDTTRLSEVIAHETPRHFELGGYNIVANIDPRNFKPAILDGSRWQNATRRLMHPGAYYRRYGQHSVAFDPRVLDLPNNVILEGEFQDERYFSDIRSTILKDLTYKEPLSAMSSALARKINDTESVSLHVRRGDYVSNKKYSEYHGLVDMGYYTKAVSIIQKQVKNPVFFVFSNDIEWCRKNIKMKSPVVFVSHNKVGADDMRLMRMCRHNILANSSFSWWGAWLNENEEKIIIAPQKWFAGKENQASKLVPDSWLRV